MSADKKNDLDIDNLKKEIDSLKKELEEEKKKSKEYLAGWQRAKADYINQEREIERQRSEWLEFANTTLILEILPIYEHFIRALEHKDKSEDFIKGLEQIKKQFEDLFKKLGVEKIKTIGEKFNPEFHEVVARQQPTNDKQQIATDTDGIIVEEVSPGYKINGKVIKVAKVVIK